MASKIFKVLVTGGAGFIGSHIVDSLVRNKYRVGVLDNLATGNFDNISEHFLSKRVSLHLCDISDFDMVSEIVGEYDAIIHQAALVSVTRSVENPLLVNNVNVNGTLNLLKAAVDSNVQKFVYASSSSVYGDTETLPKKESMNTQPISPYGVSKLSAENYCKAFAKVYGLNTISLRYFNVYGPRQKSGPYSGVIPAFVRKAVNGEQPTIFGDGNQARDFTFVQDVVQANILCLERSVAPGEVFNIACGNMITINELAQQILQIVGKPEIHPVHGPERKGDIRNSYGDISKASRELGYRPAFGISEGLERVVEWFASKVGSSQSINDIQFES